MSNTVLGANRGRDGKYVAHPLLRELRERRIELGITQESLCEKIGLGPRTISDWERGYRFPNTFNLLMWAESLNMEVCVKIRNHAEQKDAA